jgi:hypothetical protein
MERVFFVKCVLYATAGWPDGIFLKPKIPFLVYFGGGYGKCWRILRLFEIYIMAVWYNFWPFGIFYGRLVYFMVVWYSLWLFGIFYGHLVYFMAAWYILWLFGIVYGYLVYFMVVWYGSLWLFGIFYGRLVFS